MDFPEALTFDDVLLVPARSAVLYQLGCDRNEANSCVRLGKQFEEGRGVGRDEDRAIALYRKACLVGNNAACHLPLLLRSGTVIVPP